uniref:Uncharacterized protein n=1 Tax=Ascaris lumbricoides TaxID=6252 RepID=A0A9J2P5I8_ASCLU
MRTKRNNSKTTTIFAEEFAIFATFTRNYSFSFSFPILDLLKCILRFLYSMRHC